MYTPGAGLVFATDQVLAFFPDGVEVNKVRPFWEAFAQAAQDYGFVGVLDTIGSHFTQGFEDLPRFVIAAVGPSSEDARDARFALCGDVSVQATVAGSDQPLVWHGGGAAMWREEQASRATAFNLGVPYRGPNSLLPLVSGVARADGCVWIKSVVDDPGGLEAGSALATIVVPVAEPAAVAAPDEDFGRTLAELPDSWDDYADDYPEDFGDTEDVDLDDARMGASNRYADPVDSRWGLEPLNSAGGGGSFAPPTQVLDNQRQDVVPTSVLAPLPVAFAGVVRFSHGEVLELGSPIVVGRRPTHEGSGASPAARMVSVPSPLKDISRNHLEVRVENGHVLATDLGSVNGSILRRSGMPDQNLEPLVPVVLINDDVVDLGDGVTLCFEQLR